MLLSEDGSPGRKDWIDNRLKEHDRIFAISVGGFSIMDNYLHFLLRINNRAQPRPNRANRANRANRGQGNCTLIR